MDLLELTYIIHYMNLLELDFNNLLTEDKIKSQFRKKAKIYHPDKGNEKYKDGEKFKEINEAKEFLSSRIDKINLLIKSGYFRSDSKSTSESSFDEELKRKEAERKAAEEAKRKEAERKAAEEARRKEAERKAAEEAKRKEAERKLEETRNRFIMSFNKIINSYNQSDYSEKNWRKIELIIKETLTNIRNANVESSIEDYFKQGIKKLKLVNTIKRNRLYKNLVRITISALAIFVIFISVIGIGSFIEDKFYKKDLIICDQDKQIIFHSTYIKGETINLNDLNINKDYYKIEGFYLDSNFQNKIDEIEIIEDLKLFVKWTIYGAGAINNQYLIYNEDQLFNYLQAGKCYKLMNNIEISDDIINQDINLMSSIDGNGYSIILNGTINDSLFDNISSGGSISNLKVQLNITDYYGENEVEGIICEKNSGTLDNITIYAGDVRVVYNNNYDTNRYISIIVGDNYGEIKNIKLEGNYTLYNSDYYNLCLSGICGRNYGNIYNVTNNADFDGRDVSGICSLNSGTISNSLNNGRILSSFDYKEYSAVASGIVIDNYGKIINCRNNGKIMANGNSNSAAFSSGICYYNYEKAIIDYCNNYGLIFVNGSLSSNSYDYACSGIVSMNDGTISNCVNNGEFNVGVSNQLFVIAGIVFYNNAKVTNCVNNNKTYTLYSNFNGRIYISGIVGINDETGTIEYCYNNYIDNTSLNSLKKSSGISYLSGIVAINYGNINKCANYDVLSWTTNYCVFVSGIVTINNNTGTIENCYNASWIFADDTSEEYGSRAGGICCQNNGTIKYSYNGASINSGNNDWKGSITSKGTGIVMDCLWIYFEDSAVNANNETNSDEGTIKCVDDKDLLTKAKTIFPNDVWDYNDSFPVFK